MTHIQGIGPLDLGVQGVGIFRKTLFSELYRSFEAGRFDCKYRTRQLIEDGLGRIADDKARYARAGNRPHDDKIRLQPCRQQRDHLFCRSSGQVKAGREVVIGIDADPLAQLLA